MKSSIIAGRIICTCRKKNGIRNQIGGTQKFPGHQSGTFTVPPTCFLSSYLHVLSPFSDKSNYCIGEQGCFFFPEVKVKSNWVEG